MAEYNGILPVYKETGFTSNDVVAKLRGILHMRKIGHTGTLDPEATGVLPVCLGKATKLVGMLTDTDKEYRCVCRIGITTDTEDMTGTVLSENDTAGITEDEIVKAAMSFTGEYDQVPPMYSAKKINGRKLYELAREGKTVERQSCRVMIHSITLTSVDHVSDEFSFIVSCSKGTYIRTLCSDIGRKLGCGAAMKELERTRAGVFSADEALTLGQIEEIVHSGGIIEDHIKKIDDMFNEYPEIYTDRDTDRFVINGNRFSIDRPDGMYRVYLSDGRFAAVYDVRQEKAQICRYFLI